MRIQAYVLGRVVLGLAAALTVVAAVIVLVEFVELSRTLGGRVDLSFFDLLGLTCLKAPSVILLLLPFVFLFGVMGAFVALNRGSELVAMRAAGVSAWRFVAPPAGLAFLVGILCVSVVGPLAARLNARFDTASAALSQGGSQSVSQGVSQGARGEIWLRQGDDRSQVVIHARAHDMDGETVRLRGVSLFVQSVAPGGGLDFSRRIEASEARLMPGFWRLTDAREALPGEDSVRSEQLSIPSRLDRRTALEKFVSPGAVALWALPATIGAARLAGFSAAGYELRLQQLLATPLLFAAMSVLAAAFSLRLMRLGDLAILAGAGVGVGFLVFFLGELCAALGAAEVIPPVAAAWAPPLIAILSGITLLCYTEDG